MYQNILLPVDGSEQSFRALDQVIALAQGQPGTKVTVLHVSVVSYFYYTEGAVALSRDLMDEVLENGNKLLEQVGKKLQAAGIRYELVQEQGTPAKVICEYANQNPFDLVCLGSRGLGAFSEFVLGSVSHSVLHHVKTPVLIVR